jgi:hypothetical protein
MYWMSNASGGCSYPLDLLGRLKSCTDSAAKLGVGRKIFVEE